MCFARKSGVSDPFPVMAGTYQFDSYQEDAHAVAAIKLNPSILKRTAERVEKGHHWDPVAGDEFAYQVLFTGIYDGMPAIYIMLYEFNPYPSGHGGSEVSQWLQENLQRIFETVDPKTVPDVVSAIKAYGGYFRRFRGGALQPWSQAGWDAEDYTEMNLTLEAYATLAFLQVRHKYILQGAIVLSPYRQILRSANCLERTTLELLHQSLLYTRLTSPRLPSTHLNGSLSLLHIAGTLQ